MSSAPCRYHSHGYCSISAPLTLGSQELHKANFKPLLAKIRRGRNSEKQKVCAVVLSTPGGFKKNIESDSHVAILQGLGNLGEISPRFLPLLLKINHIRSFEDNASSDNMQQGAFGLRVWDATLNRGLLPDDESLKQIISDNEPFTKGCVMDDLKWPCDVLRDTLIKGLSKLGVARFAKKYPGIRDALLISLLEAIVQYYRILLDVPEEVSEADKQEKYKTWAEIQEEEARQRAIRLSKDIPESMQKKKEEKIKKKDVLSALPIDKRAAITATKTLYEKWQAPMQALSKAGKAFEGLEALLGGGRSGVFELSGNIWSRKGWVQMDELRRKLEDLKELRDLVRSLGRGGGWGPLRRAPIQFFSPRGRDGLLRTILEQQETRGLTRSDDISRLLPAESALLAKGRQIRQAKLLFFARLAEKALQTYERDGWGQYPTDIIPERREIRPTAERGPILLCVDTSGSMQGPREIVAKALTLECMRAAKEQERDCYVFAFSGPNEVRELELNQDMKSVNNLLDFLEKIFNGGSDFNEPVKRCLERLTDAKWANSDILLVSDGELRQPGPEIMRKLYGAKEKMGLRVHGLIIGSPETKRADPAVLRSLCTNYLTNGKTEIRVQEFEGWESVQQDQNMKFDWDDIAGDSHRRMINLQREQERQKEIKRLRILKKESAKAIKKH